PPPLTPPAHRYGIAPVNNEGGMRRRPNQGGTHGGAAPYNEAEDLQSQQQGGGMMQQQQQQQQQQRRTTANRLDEAHLVEKTLSDLTTMFSSLSNLIMQQGEALEKIEDDVVQAGLEVDSGASEINKTHSRKKGDRPLIIKVFAVLILLILIMKFF
ncbi:hypothetical protein TeGR_g4291, partial [Tetraparma gracilis]